MNFAFEFLFTGDIISAEKALELGIVNKVAPHEELASATDEYVQKLITRRWRFEA